MAVLVVETALGGPAGETLPARLLPITANLAPLAFGTSVGCCDAFASRVARGFAAFGSICRVFPGNHTLKGMVHSTLGRDRNGWRHCTLAADVSDEEVL